MSRWWLCSLAIMLAVGGCSDDKPPPPSTLRPVSISMSAAAWVFQHSPGMPSSPAPYGDGWSFDFPSSNGVHYLVTPVSGYVAQSVSITLSVEGGTATRFVEVEPCQGSRAAMRLYFQQRGDDLSAAKEFHRWWSVATFPLAPAGETTLLANIQASEWSSVFGKRGDQDADVSAAFAAAAADVQAIGMTFGGCFAGHGVFVQDGAAKFVAHKFEVR